MSYADPYRLLLALPPVQSLANGGVRRFQDIIADWRLSGTYIGCVSPIGVRQAAGLVTMVQAAVAEYSSSGDALSSGLQAAAAAISTFDLAANALGSMGGPPLPAQAWGNGVLVGGQATFTNVHFEPRGVTSGASDVQIELVRTALNGTPTASAGQLLVTSSSGWATGAGTFTVESRVAPAALAVTDASGTPIVLTLDGTVPASVVAGTSVTVSGVAGNTAANGTWAVQSTGSSTITLSGSASDNVATVTATSGSGLMPIEVSVISIPPGCVPGAIVNIAGVTGNTAANGTWVVASVSPPTLIVLPAYTTGNGTYLGGGTVTVPSHGGLATFSTVSAGDVSSFSWLATG